MSIQLIDDKELVKRYIAGEEKALNHLINRHQTNLFNYIYSYIPDYDAANDIFQDTFFKVIRKLKSGYYKEEGKFFPWVIRICRNLIIDSFRLNKKLPKVRTKDDFDIFSVLPLLDENIEDEMIKEQIISDVRNLIETLPEEQKEVLVMRYYRDLSFKEIAEETDVSINTALGRMRYALMNMRKEAEKNNLILQ